VIQGLTPLAFLLSPSKMNMPVDIALGVLLPLHGHIGMNYVITDYATKLFGRLVGYLFMCCMCTSFPPMHCVCHRGTEWAGQQGFGSFLNRIQRAFDASNSSCNITSQLHI